MTELITVRGFVASDVREDKTHQGHAVSSFRLGATERRFNRETNAWEDGETNWFSIVCFRSLAKNVGFSVQRGERIIVTGRLKIRNWSMPDGRSGTTADIEAETVGHDLVLGVTKYKRNSATAAEGGAGAPENGDMAADLDLAGVNTETGELLDAPNDDGGPLADYGETAEHTDGDQSEESTSKVPQDKAA